MSSTLQNYSAMRKTLSLPPEHQGAAIARLQQHMPLEQIAQHQERLLNAHYEELTVLFGRLLACTQSKHLDRASLVKVEAAMETLLAAIDNLVAVLRAYQASTQDPGQPHA